MTLSKQNSGVKVVAERSRGEPKWAKRSATANRMNFVRLVDSAGGKRVRVLLPRTLTEKQATLLASRRERLHSDS